MAIFGLIPARDKRRASGKALWDERNGCEEGGAALARRVAAAAKDRRRSGELLKHLLWGVNPQREAGAYNDGEDGGRGVGGGRGVWWGGADAALGDDAGSLDGSGRGSLRVAGASQAIAEAPMKAQRRLGLDLSWSRITPVFVIDVAVLLLVTRCWPERMAARCAGVVGRCRCRGGGDAGRGDRLSGDHDGFGAGRVVVGLVR